MGGSRGDYVEVKGDCNLVVNSRTVEWSPVDKVMTELVLKTKRFKREEKIMIKFT